MGKGKNGSKKNSSVNRQGSIQSSFLSSMSHDLRTPLNSILSLSRVLQLQAKKRLTEEEFSYLEVIERNGRILLSLINDIIDFSKMDAGRIELNIKKINLKPVLTTIIENHEELVEEKGILVNLEVDSNVPDLASDEVMLYKIFHNIIGNAVKFTEKGSVSIHVTSDGNSISAVVKDTGIGIDKDDLPRIFDEFGRIEGKLSKKYDGTGLGLAIALRAAKLISATISAKSVLGEGSEFTIILPVSLQCDLSGNNESERKSAVVSDKSGGEYKKPLLLVIEDDPDNMTTIKVILREDFRIMEAMDGKTGLLQVLEHHPDIVLLDMALPQMNGFMVVKRIRDDDNARTIPVIAMTALTMYSDRKRIIEAGCDDYLAKPFDIELLKKTIKQWVKRQHE